MEEPKKMGSILDVLLSDIVGSTAAAKGLPVLLEDLNNITKSLKIITDKGDNLAVTLKSVAAQFEEITAESKNTTALISKLLADVSVVAAEYGIKVS